MIGNRNKKQTTRRADHRADSQELLGFGEAIREGNHIAELRAKSILAAAENIGATVSAVIQAAEAAKAQAFETYVDTLSGSADEVGARAHQIEQARQAAVRAREGAAE